MPEVWYGNEELDDAIPVLQAATELVQLIRDVGEETDWRDGDETDRVFAWHEFEALRKALED